jgi:hypothetical protein
VSLASHCGRGKAIPPSNISTKPYPAYNEPEVAIRPLSIAYATIHINPRTAQHSSKALSLRTRGRWLQSRPPHEKTASHAYPRTSHSMEQIRQINGLLQVAVGGYRARETRAFATRRKGFGDAGWKNRCFVCCTAWLRGWVGGTCQ